MADSIEYFEITLYEDGRCVVVGVVGRRLSFDTPEEALEYVGRQFIAAKESLQ